MTNPKISIIMPVFNAEKYLSKCLDTIVLQTYENLEIICINDGSTDCSEEILKEYAQKDNRIIILNQENSGQSIARNKGMELATGEYISFIDSDDLISLSLYQKFVKALKSVNSDMDIYMFNADILSANQSLSEIKIIHTFGIDAWKIKPDQLLCSVEDCSNPFDGNMAVWNKIYKKSYLNSLNLKFKENLIFEDKLFHFETFLRTKKIYINKEALYHYRQHSTSTMHTMKNNVFDIFKIIPLINKALIDSNTYEKNKYAFFQFLIKHFVYLLVSSSPSDSTKLYELAQKNLKEFVDNNLDPKIYNRLKWIETYYHFMRYSYDDFMKIYKHPKQK